MLFRSQHTSRHLNKHISRTANTRTKGEQHHINFHSPSSSTITHCAASRVFANISVFSSQVSSLTHFGANFARLKLGREILTGSLILDLARSSMEGFELELPAPPHTLPFAFSHPLRVKSATGKENKPLSSRQPAYPTRYHH